MFKQQWTKNRPLRDSIWSSDFISFKVTNKNRERSYSKLSRKTVKNFATKAYTVFKALKKNYGQLHRRLH